MENEARSFGFRSSSGFTRTDAITLVCVLPLLAAAVWAGLWTMGEGRRIYVCAHHLQKLGQAFTEYTQDHKEALPPAVFDVGHKSISWDTQIAGYLEPALVKTNSPDEQKALKAKIAYLFHCPSDTEPRGGVAHRSYSMPIYDINRAGWPPDEESEGGLGLYIDTKTLRKARQAMGPDSAGYMPAIKTSIVPAPRSTALLVERISILNDLWGTRDACTTSVNEQFEAKTIARQKFHDGKMNYLFLDGHVELLSPAQSGGQTVSGDGGLWTIRPED